MTNAQRTRTAAETHKASPSARPRLRACLLPLQSGQRQKKKVTRSSKCCAGAGLRSSRTMHVRSRIRTMSQSDGRCCMLQGMCCFEHRCCHCRDLHSRFPDSHSVRQVLKLHFFQSLISNAAISTASQHLTLPSQREQSASSSSRHLSLD